MSLSQNYYSQPFYITQNVSNNRFHFEERHNKKIYVPALKNGKIEDVKRGKEVVFEDFNDEGKLNSCQGLENFVFTHLGQVPTYIFDNHNHAFYFWYKERWQGTLKDNSLLIHIDQHKDSRIPESFLNSEEVKDLGKVFEYTNGVLNVGNFIPPAQKAGLIEEVIFIDSEYSIDNFPKEKANHPNLILDIDLDFFEPSSDYIGNDKKLVLIEKLLPQAQVITFATSPFFIDQDLALFWLHRIAQSAHHA